MVVRQAMMSVEDVERRELELGDGHANSGGWHLRDPAFMAQLSCRHILKLTESYNCMRLWDPSLP